MEKRLLTSRDLWDLKFQGDVEISRDGSKVFWVETTINAKKNHYESSIWTAQKGPDGSFGAPIRVTYGRRPDGDGSLDRCPRLSPDGKYLAFLSNRTGKNQIYVLDLTDGGEARQVTTGEDGASEITWSPDSRHMAFISREPKPKEDRKDDEIRTDKDVTVVTKLRYKANGVPGVVDPRPQQVFIVDVVDGTTRQLTYGEYDNASPAFSRDGKYVAFTSCRTPDRELVNIPDLWVVPVEGGEPERLTFSQGPVHAPVYSPDGTSIALLGHLHGDNGAENVEVLLLEKGAKVPVSLTESMDRSVGCSVGSDARSDAGRPGPFWSKDGKYIYFIATDRGFTKVYRVCRDSRVIDDLSALSPEMPPVVTSMALAEDADGTIYIPFVGESGIKPCEVYLLKISEGKAEVQRLTRSNDAWCEKFEISTPEFFQFEGKDGLPLEGWMIKPARFEAGKKYPAIVEIHGGPHVTYGEAFFFEFQLLASKGFGIFFCNPRGSSGYGRKFTKMVVGDWGGMDYQDIMALADRAEKEDWVDSCKMGVTGGSYGGYMTNWIVGHTSRFAAAVTQRSISNMYTKYGTSDIGFYGNKKGFGDRDLWDNESFIMERSPIRYAPSVKTPLLILHSEQDYRCPMEQAEQWYVALKRLGKTVEFVRFAGENHELSRSGKPWNRVERLDRITGWFEKYLKNA